MQTINIEVDDETAMFTSDLSAESKVIAGDEVTLAVKKKLLNTRAAKLKKMIEELNNDPMLNDLDPEILLEVIRCNNCIF